jgi:hypothetical protein
MKTCCSRSGKTEGKRFLSIRTTPFLGKPEEGERQFLEDLRDEILRCVFEHNTGLYSRIFEVALDMLSKKRDFLAVERGLPAILPADGLDFPRVSTLYRLSEVYMKTTEWGLCPACKIFQVGASVKLGQHLITETK